MTPRARLVILIALFAGGAAAFAAPQVRDNTTAAGALSSTISGRVVIDGPSPQPARRVRVTLTETARKHPGQTATTNDDGTFQFGAVPAGRYDVQAFKNGYLRASYGASRPDRAGTPVVIGEAEVFEFGRIEQTVQIQMDRLHRRQFIGLEQRVARALDRAAGTECTQRAACERRLARSQLARQLDHAARRARRGSRT